MELLLEWCAVLMAWCSENEVCSSILDFLHWLNYPLHTVAILKCLLRQRSLAVPWLPVGSYWQKRSTWLVAIPGW